MVAIMMARIGGGGFMPFPIPTIAASFTTTTTTSRHISNLEFNVFLKSVYKFRLHDL